jgi:hypothetical protein
MNERTREYTGEEALGRRRWHSGERRKGVVRELLSKKHSWNWVMFALGERASLARIHGCMNIADIVILFRFIKQGFWKKFRTSAFEPI